jgi:hypothetical protein
LVPACLGFYLSIKYSSFHPEADQITYKELKVKRKKEKWQKKIRLSSYFPIYLVGSSPGSGFLTIFSDFNTWTALRFCYSI